MTNNEMISSLSKTLEISQAETRRLLKSSAETIQTLLDENHTISIPGLGTFKAILTKRRKSFNPNIKKFMLHPIKQIVRFRASSTLKEEVKNVRIGIE